MIDLAKQRAEARLQILLAQTTLGAEDVALAHSLIGQVEDWGSFVRQANRNFCLPLMQRHVAQLNPDEIPADVRAMMQQAATQVALHNMKLVVSQRQFQNLCLKPIGVPGIFFKGINLAAQYYPDIGLRPSRDIDVLVPKGSLYPMVIKALEEGYQLVSPDTQQRPMVSPQDIDAMLRLSEDVYLLSPDGAVFDLQQKLDKHSGIFSQYDVFGQSEGFVLGGETFQTMAPDFLFNYLCHHHARHTWSRLHWLSDVDAICASERFDPEAALDLAERLGQRGTVEAVLELRALMSAKADWDSGPDLAHGKAFLELAIRNLPGDLQLEKKLSLPMKGGEFMFGWQARPDLVAKAQRGWWRSIFQPTLKQYLQMPLPKRWQWVYYAPRFVQLMRETAVRTITSGKMD
jgi:hypothetical protein